MPHYMRHTGKLTLCFLSGHEQSTCVKLICCRLKSALVPDIRKKQSLATDREQSIRQQNPQSYVTNSRKKKYMKVCMCKSMSTAVVWKPLFASLSSSGRKMQRDAAMTARSLCAFIPMEKSTDGFLDIFTAWCLGCLQGILWWSLKMCV